MQYKFCVNCKHVETIAGDFICLSPGNYKNLVTGKLIRPFCTDSRYGEEGPCGEEGLLFENKEVHSYA